MQLVSLASVVLLASVANAQDVIDVSMATALSASVSATCVAIQGQIYGLLDGYKGFSATSYGSFSDTLNIQFGELGTAGSNLQKICYDIGNSLNGLSSSYSETEAGGVKGAYYY